MSQSFTDTTIATLIDLCTGTDQEQLERNLENLTDCENGLDLCTNESKLTLLHVMAADKKFSKWDVILKYFTYINATDSQQRTPLHVAVTFRNLKAVSALLDVGALPTVEDDHGLNCIETACHGNWCDGLRVILSKSFAARRYVVSKIAALGKMCIEGNLISAYNVLLKFVKNAAFNVPDEDGFCLVHYAAMSKNPMFLKRLLEKNKIDVNIKSPKEKTAIEMAVTLEATEMLYAKGAPIPKDKKQAGNLTKFMEEVLNAPKWSMTGKSAFQCELHKAAASEAGVQSISNLSSNTRFDVVDAFKITPMMIAVRGNVMPVITELLKKGANPNVPSSGTNAFHLAAVKGNARAIAAFMEAHTPDYTALDNKGRTVLVCGLHSGNVDVVKCLLQKIGHIEAPFEPIVEEVAKIQDASAAEIVLALISKGFPPTASTEKGTLLSMALEAHKDALASALISKGALPEEERDACAITAVTNDMPLVIAELGKLKVSFVIMNGGWQLFHSTVRHKTADAAKTVLQTNEQLKTVKDTKGNTFLHRAAQMSNTACIELALGQMGLDVNATNNAGSSPLHMLVQQPTEPQVFISNFALLIERKAKLDHKNLKGQNIMHVLAESDNDIAATAIFGTDDNSPLIPEVELETLMKETDSQGMTPLECASRQKKLKVAKVFNKNSYQLPIFEKELITYEDLEEHYAKQMSPDVCDKEGTPLVTRVIKQTALTSEDKVKCLELLVMEGVDIEIADAEQLTPLHHAIRLDDKELVKHLIDNGAPFIVEPVIRVFCEKEEKEDMIDLIAQPEKRSSAVYEVKETQLNTVSCLRSILKFENRFNVHDENSTMCAYMDDLKKMLRMLEIFCFRLDQHFKRMRPSTEFSKFFMFFSDAFVMLLNIPTRYHQALSEINANPTLAPILHEQIGWNNYSLSDALIVPVQQLTRYHELIRAIIKATPKDHPDSTGLQRAHLKYSNLGRAANQGMLIAESREKLKMIRLVSSLNHKELQYMPNDILIHHGQFERKGLNEPPKAREMADSPDYGLKTNEVTSGTLTVTYFTTYGKSLKSFMKAPKISIFLFSKIILFGLQKKESTFKMKFSCRVSEVHWDFSREYGADSFRMWTPIGELLLKVDPAKGSSAEYEKTVWKQNVEKIGQIPDTEEQTVGGSEIVYTTWVNKQIPAVHAKLFCVSCATKTEAKEKIKQKLEELGVQIVTKPVNIPLINYDFQTYQPAQGQQSDVISDVELP